MTKPAFKRQSERHTPALLVPIIAIAIMAMGSCSRRSDTSHFDNPVQALEACEGFLHSLKTKKGATTDDIIATVRQWRELADSARHCIYADTAVNTHYCAAFFIYCDSVGKEMSRLIDGRERTLADYHKTMCELNEVQLSKTMQQRIDSCAKFFASLDTTDTYHTSAKRTIFLYGRTLTLAKVVGFKSRADVLRFIRNEDRDFRAFLNHLPMLKDVSLADIRRQTEEVADSIYALTDAELPVISKEDAVVLMTMRTNRRLLQNAKVCVADVKKGRAAGSGMEAAYMMMLMQPWMTADDATMAMMTPEQREDMARLAIETPKALDELFKSADSTAKRKDGRKFIKGIVSSMMKTYVEQKCRLL